MAWTGRQVFPFTAATRKRTCGATERIMWSTPDQAAGTGVADGAPAGRSSRPAIRPRASVAMSTVSLELPFAVTTNAMVPGVLLVIESSRRLRTDTRTLFSRAAGTCARNVASKWALIAETGNGGCATAPSSQCACRPTGVSGKLTVACDGPGLADVSGADESQPVATAIAQAAATAVAVAAAARKRLADLADPLLFM